MKILVCSFLSFFCISSYAVSCDVYTYDQLLGCISNNVTINLKADITLLPNQNINVHGISNLTINGLDNGAKHFIAESFDRFVSQSSNNPYYIYVLNSSNIKIENLIFKSLAASDSQCTSGKAKFNTAPCWGDVLVKDSSHIRIYSNEFLSQKTFQLQIVDSFDTNIENNKFKNAATFGLWVTSNPGGAGLRDLRVISNSFEKAGANAILSAGVRNGWIGNNSFLDNHRLTQFSGHVGGQLLIEDNPNSDTSDLSITGNTIVAASVTTSHGIEFANFDNGRGIRNVRMAWNNIVGNKHSAIVFDTSQPTSLVEKIEISDNQFVNNGSTYRSQTITKAFNGIEISNNTIQKSASYISASFLDTPKTCALAPGQSVCSVMVKWSASSGIDPYITIRSFSNQIGSKNRGLFSAGVLQGSQQAAWIDKAGAIFELYDKRDYDQVYGWEAPIASIIVKAVD